MIDQKSAEQVLKAMGKRLRVMPIEEAGDALREDMNGDAAVMPAMDDYTDVIVAAVGVLAEDRATARLLLDEYRSDKPTNMRSEP